MALTTSSLNDSMVIHPPTSPDEAPAILAFERFREIDIDWEQLFDTVDPGQLLSEYDDEKAPLSQHKSLRDPENGFYRFIIDQWESFLGRKITDADLFQTESEDSDPILNPPLFKVAVGWYLEGPTAKSINGLSLLYPPVGRSYMPCNNQGLPLVSEVVHDPSSRRLIAYDAQGQQITGPITLAWLKKLLNEEMASVKVLYEDERSVKDFSPSSSYISRKPMLWQSQYRELKKERNLNNKLYDLFEKKLNDKQFDEIWNSQEEFDEFKQKYIEYGTLAKKTEEKIRKLLQEVKDSGYVLADRDMKVRRPDNGELVSDVKEGQLYRVRREEIKWSVNYSVWETRRTRGSSGRRRTRRVLVKKTRHMQAVIPVWEQVENFSDPVDQYLQGLGARAQEVSGDQQSVPSDKQLNVYNVRSSSAGYITAEGEALSDIMRRCELSEDERRSTIIVIQEYSPFLSNRSVYLGAYIFERPLPGIFVEKFPKVSVKESLSYTIMWTGIELGQLVATIPLAPGEERSIAVAHQMTEEVTTSSSFARTNEFTSNQSYDLATQFEEEASRSFEKSNSSSGSVEAGFSYGGFGTRANGSSSSSSTLKTFNRNIAKIARKAAQSTSRSYSQTITSKQTQTSSLNRSSSRTMKLSNINQGSTLNMMFYQLNNRFEGGLYLDDLEITIQSGKELIAGTEIYDLQSFRIDDLDSMMECLTPRNLPSVITFRDPNSKSNDICSKRRDRYWYNLMKHLIKIITQEYAKHETPKPESVELVNFEFTFDKVGSEKPIVCTDISELLTDGENRQIQDSYSSVHRLSDELKDALRSLIISRSAIESQKLVVASGGLYLDTIIGSGKALDSYSENIREVTYRDRLADLTYKRGINRALFGDGSAPDTDGAPTVNRIKAVMPAGPNLSILWLVTQEIISGTHWEVFLGPKQLSVGSIKKTADRQLEIDFVTHANTPKSHDYRSIVIRSDDGQTLAYENFPGAIADD